MAKKEANHIQYGKILPALLVLYPYTFIFLQSMSLAYILMIFVTIYLVYINIIQKRIINKAPLLLVMILISLSLLAYPNTSIYSYSGVLIDIFKLLVWGVFLSLVSSVSIDKSIVTNSMVNLSLVASVYLLIQTIVHYGIGFNLPNVISLGIIDFYTTDLRNLTNFRPASFYSEPSYFATQIAVTISLLLFTQEEYIGRKKIIIFLILSTILSTSTTGIYIVIILLLLKLIYTKRNVVVKYYSLIAVAIFLLILLSNIDLFLAKLSNWGKIGSSLKYAIEKPQYFEDSSRIGGSYNYLSNLNGFQRIIGYGLGNEYIHLGTVTYMNSLTRLILQTGYLGLGVFLIFIIKLTINARNLFSMSILIIYIIGFVTGGAMFSVTGMYLLAFYYIYNKKEDNL